MEYISNATFAIRSMELYEQQLDGSEYEFTAVCGVLLNILSAIKPDKRFLIDIDSISNDDLPKFNEYSKKSVEKYLSEIRNGLAHKTKSNFKDFPDEVSRKIRYIKIKSIVLSKEDLLKIYNILKNELILKYGDESFFPESLKNSKQTNN